MPLHLVKSYADVCWRMLMYAGRRRRQECRCIWCPETRQATPFSTKVNPKFPCFISAVLVQKYTY
jgi:hypothetical protein